MLSNVRYLKLSITFLFHNITESLSVFSWVVYKAVEAEVCVQTGESWFSNLDWLMWNADVIRWWQICKAIDHCELHRQLVRVWLSNIGVFPKCFHWIRWIQRTYHLLCKRPGCYHSTSKIPMRDRIMLRWFVRFPEFAEFSEFNESSAPFWKTQVLITLLMNLFKILKCFSSSINSWIFKINKDLNESLTFWIAGRNYVI